MSQKTVNMTFFTQGGAGKLSSRWICVFHSVVSWQTHVQPIYNHFIYSFFILKHIFL